MPAVTVYWYDGGLLPRCPEGLPEGWGVNPTCHIFPSKMPKIADSENTYCL